MAAARAKVLVVDDSPVVRQVIRRLLEADPWIGAVDTAASGNLALKKIHKHQPDVVTLDVEMPGMDGLQTLERIMREAPRPVVMLSAHTFEGADKTIHALELGAVDFIQKPASSLSSDVSLVGKELIAKIKALVSARRRKARRSGARSEARELQPRPRMRDSQAEIARAVGLVAIGASTGGTEAIRTVLTQLPENFALPIVVVQHMPQGFTRSFAERLDQLSAIEVKEASHHDMLRPGRALIAPGHSHLAVGREGGLGFAALNRLPEVNGHRPSVDVLFGSVARHYGDRAIAVLLTGMGRDGASGMASLHERGAITLAQDESSCVVYGMPKAAIDEGGVQRVVPLAKIPYWVQRAAAQLAPEDEQLAAPA